MKKITNGMLLCLAAAALAGCGASSDAGTPKVAKRQGAVAAQTDTADYTTVLQQIYVGYFGRPADPAGLVYYADMLRSVGAPTTLLELSLSYNSNPTLKSIIDGFGFSQESRELYPGDDASFVTAVYVNMFNRAPDSAGKSYWTGMIGSGTISRANAALSIMAGARNSDIAIVENKAAVASKFTATLDSPSRLGSYNGNNASEMARTMLRKVGQDTAADAFQGDIDSAVNAMVAGSATPARTVLAAAKHSMALKPDGSLWVWGDNSNGELGSSAFTGKQAPYRVGDGYVAIAAGYGHSFALKADGSLYGWGWNLLGQLGNGATANLATPTKVGAGYAGVSTGYGHTLAVKFDRSLWAWGMNDHGQLGIGSRVPSKTPVRVGDGFSAVAAGFSHSLALKPDGSLWTWGAGGFGQQGDGANNDLELPHQIGTGFKAIAAGSQFSLALKADGSLWSWGYNDSGQLGVGHVNNSNRPLQVGTGYTAISAAGDHAMALKSDGTLWAWGGNGGGQIGDGTTQTRVTPVQVGTGFVSIVAGDEHSLATKADGSLWSWGRNDQGQLGNGGVLSGTLPRQLAATGGDGAGVPGPSPKVTIAGVTPLTAQQGQSTNFVVKGSNLSAGLVFRVEGCLASSVGADTGSDTSRTFICTPLVAGRKTGSVSAATGERLFDFSVTVNDTATVTRPVMSNHSPTTATVNEAATFVITGADLPDRLVFSLDGCSDVAEVAGGTASRRQFRCTPASSGVKSGELKTADGTSLGKLSVTVSPAIVSSNSINGLVAIAPVAGATVKAYAITAGVKGVLLATTSSGANGDYAVQLGTYSGLVLLEADGGLYTDPATGASTRLSPIRSIVMVNGATVANLTPFTEPVVANAGKLSGGMSSTNVASTLLTIKTQLGFDPVATKPADPNKEEPAGASTNSIVYAGLLGSASQYAADNQEKTMPVIQQDISALLATLANVNPFMVQSADNYRANPRNVQGLGSNLGSGMTLVICKEGLGKPHGSIPWCLTRKPVITCLSGKVPKDGVCVKDTSTPVQPGRGTFDGAGGGTGKDAAQCISISTRLKDNKNYYTDVQVMKNNCGVKIAVMMCISPSSVKGTAGSVCGATQGHYYTKQFWLEPGGIHDNPYSMPVGATIYYGACSGGKYSQPSIDDVGTTGSYRCI
jgi:alpha-tubulin suppressor-like RCC1 family protein